MNRRTFLHRAGTGLGLLCVSLGSLGCGSSNDFVVTGTNPTAAVDFGVAQISDNLLYAFGPNGLRIEIDPNSHQVVGFNAAGSELFRIESDPESGVLNYPLDVQVASDGRIYVLDHGNGEVDVFDPNGTSLGSIIGANGRLLYPRDMLLDEPVGELYISDSSNHQIVVFSLTGQRLRSFGSQGFEAGQFNLPTGLAFDGAGNLLVVDSGNSVVQLLSKAGQFISTLGAYGTDEGQFLRPSSIAVDADGDIYIADIFTGFITVFRSDRSFKRRFSIAFPDGTPAVPIYLTVGPESTLYITALPGFQLEEAS